jgi:hypothetical protein
MPTLRSRDTCSFSMPGYRDPETNQTFKPRLEPGATLEVPQWYLDRLLKLRCWRVRTDANGNVRRKLTGPGGAFRRRIEERKSVRSAELRKVERENGDLAARLAETERKLNELLAAGSTKKPAKG